MGEAPTGSGGGSGTMRIAAKAALGDESLDVMNFLNEVVLRYPQAVSFAPGRPAEEHFDVEGSLAKVALWVDHHAVMRHGRAGDQLHVPTSLAASSSVIGPVNCVS